MRKGLVILLLLVMTLSLAGCWNRRELNDLAVAAGIAIDKVGKNEYLVTVQVVDPGQVAPRQSGGGRSPITVYSQKADTVFEALRKITTDSPRKIYLSHLRILVIGRTLAEEGLAESLDFLSRDHEVRSDFYVVIAKNTSAANILNFVTPLEKIPAQKLFKSLEVSQQAWAPTHTVQLDELVSNMISEGKEPVLTTILHKGNEKVQGSQENTQGAKPEASLVYNGLAVLRRDKLVGWMNDKESKGYSYLSSEVKNTVGSVPCPDGNGSFVIEVFNSNAKVKAKVKDGKPKIHVKLYNEMNIAEVRCKIDLTSVDTIKKLEKLTEHSNKDIAMTSIKKAKKLKSDVFGFGEAIHRAAPKTWKKLRKNWDTEGFVEVPVEIESEVKIRRTGTMSKSYLKDLNPKE